MPSSGFWGYSCTHTHTQNVYLPPFTIKILPRFQNNPINTVSFLDVLWAFIYCGVGSQYMYTCHCKYVEVRWQLVGDSSLPLPPGPYESAKVGTYLLYNFKKMPIYLSLEFFGLISETGSSYVPLGWSASCLCFSNARQNFRCHTQLHLESTTGK